LAVASEQLAKINENHSMTFEAKNIGLIFSPLPTEYAMRFALCAMPVQLTKMKTLFTLSTHTY